MKAASTGARSWGAATLLTCFLAKGVNCGTAGTGGKVVHTNKLERDFGSRGAKADELLLGMKRSNYYK